MEIHQLRYFVAVADEGSFSRAAAKVRVAQPSLSQQIRKLETEVGQPLFDRLPRSVVLTEAGRCLIDYARQILASIGDARRCVDELKGEVAGNVAVGAIPTIAPYVLPELVVTFQKHYPDVTLENWMSRWRPRAGRVQLFDENLWAPNHCWRSCRKNIPWQRRISWNSTIS